jgi:hypothetical protein
LDEIQREIKVEIEGGGAVQQKSGAETMMKPAMAIAALSLCAGPSFAADVISPASSRFAAEEVKEVPDFQRHVLPMMGKLGCNGRACHGSFQGAGGLRLSLFGYDFKADHEALTQGEKPRIDLESPEASRIIAKPTLKMPHKGGERLKVDSWEHRLLLRWVQSGAKPTKGDVQFKSLDVTPKEMVFKKPGDTTPLKVLAKWSDGSVEDVTCLCRFRSNDESIAKIDADGVVTCVNKGDTHVVAFYDNGVSPVSAMLPVSEKAGDNYPDIAARTRVDQLIVAKLKKLGVTPSEICTDAEFLRRVSLDVTGTLPAPAEVEAFLKDGSQDKRRKKVDELLERPGYAAWWTTKLCDTTGQALNQLQEQSQLYSRAIFKGWYDWIHARVASNAPYDKIVEGIVLAKGRDPGQSYEAYAAQLAALARGDGAEDFTKRETMPFYWMRRNVQKAEEKSLNFAYAFLGVRLQCAECHKHPFDQWTQQDFQQFTAFFTPVQYVYSPEANKAKKPFEEKYGLNDKKLNGREREERIKKALDAKDAMPVREVALSKPRPQRPQGKNKAKNQPAGRVITPKVLGGDEVVAANYGDSREPLMDWMRSESNPYFATAFVNRVWANYFNVGIVDPPDDMNLANPPSNDALLEYLASGFVKSGYDMKWLHREICNSDAYQRSWKPNETNELDTKNFSHAVVRRIPAEVVYDALVQCTSNAEEAARLVSDPVGRAIGNLAPEGRGRRGQDAFALRIFGKPERATSCDCERMSDPTLVQSLYLRNDNDIRNLLDRREGWIPAIALATGMPVNAPPPNSKDDKGRGGKGTKTKSDAPVPSLSDQITAVENRIRRVKQLGKEKEKTQLPNLEKQLATLKQRQADQAKAVKSVGGSKKLEPTALIREAYLRTLSRPPTSDEMAIAKEYFSDSRNTLVGLRDLVWALINTKEFITNH